MVPKTKKLALFAAILLGAVSAQAGQLVLVNNGPATVSNPCSVTGTTVSYRSHTVTTANTAANITITKPTGTVEGDVMVAMLYADANSWSVTPPTDWLLIVSTANLATSPDTNNKTYYKRAGASEGANYQWTFSSVFRQGFIITFKDANTNVSCGPMEADTSMDVGSGTYDMEMDNVYANTINMIGVADFDGNADTPPTDWTERFDSSNVSGITRAFPSAGNTGSASGSIAGAAPFATSMVGVLD